MTALAAAWLWSGCVPFEDSPGGHAVRAWLRRAARARDLVAGAVTAGAGHNPRLSGPRGASRGDPTWSPVGMTILDRLVRAPIRRLKPDRKRSATDDGAPPAATQLLEQERQTVRRLRELDAARADFLGLAQHELRTPMLAITGQLELITLAWERWDDATKRGAIREIAASARMLSDLMEAVIDFTRLSAERVRLTVAGVDLADVVESVSAEVAQRFPDAVAVGVDIALGLRVRADERRLRQVVRSLLDNAVSATPSGGTVGIQARAEAGDRVLIVICDTGSGIGTEMLPHVFEPFVQGHGHRTGRGGLGMGLAVTRLLCDAHDASITIRSVAGEGTEVTLSWPAAAADLTTSRGDGFHVSGA